MPKRVPAAAFSTMFTAALAARTCVFVLCAVALLACGRDRQGQAAPHYPEDYVGTKVNFGNVDWAARQQRIISMMPEVELKVRQKFMRMGLPSLVAGVLVDGRLVWWQGFGQRDLEAGGPVTAHTIYRVGSVTKVVTAMAILRLRDEGKLPLDTPAVTHLPELGTMKYPTTDSPQITIRHLLTHTSGLPRLGAFDYYTDRATPVSDREILEGLRGAELENVPGVTMLYSNLGYALLGMIVGRVAKLDYFAFVDQKILGPLQMGSASWRREQVPHDRLATGYVWEANAYHARHHWKFGASEGMGGLYGSLDDMVRLVSFHMTAWPPGARPNKEPLHNATLRESHLTGGFQHPGKGIALGGWAVERHHLSGDTVVSHEGVTHQYAAAVMFVPQQRIGFVALTNTGKPATVGPLAREVVVLIMRGLGAGKRGKRRRSVIRR